MASCLTVDPESQYLLIFNPHAWEIRGNVEYDFNRGSESNSARVEDEKGNVLLHQWAPGSTEVNGRKKLVVNTTVPPFGYRQIRLLEGDTLKSKTVASAQDNKLENEYLTVHFSTTGAISIFDKENGKELFSGGESGCRAVIIDDPSDTLEP